VNHKGALTIAGYWKGGGGKISHRCPSKVYVRSGVGGRVTDLGEGGEAHEPEGGVMWLT